VINKNDAHAWLFGGPSAGEIRRLHPVGYDPDRAADARSRVASSELRAALARSLEQLEEAWDALAEDGWSSQGIVAAGPRTMAEIVAHHLRNVEVHHVDLDVGYRPSDWPAPFVEAELIKRMRALPDRADHAELLAWLLGRAPAPELTEPW
jgi:maleylpyruvate isomerase